MSAPVDEWETWLADWLLSLRHQHPDTTLAVYERSVRQFFTFLADDGRSTEVGDATKRDVEAWLASMVDVGRSQSTRRVRLMALRGFFGWVITEPHAPLTVNVAAAVTAPTVDLPHIEVVPDESIVAVLNTAAGGSYVDLRDTAIIRLLASTGLRRSELVGLDMDDVKIRDGELYVTGKGNKPRVVSFGGSRLPLALSRYDRARRRHPGHAAAPFFLSSRETPGAGWRMTGGAIALMLKRRCVAAGVPIFKPHQLRHTWAHQTKVAGLSDEDLERMAGWSSPMMARRYGRAMADERARDAHRKLNLGDRL